MKQHLVFAFLATFVLACAANRPSAADLAATDWQGLGFGVALSGTFDISKGKRIDGERLDENGIVRVDHNRDVRARIGLETHYFGDCNAWGKGLLSLLASWSPGECGVGPFVVVNFDQEEIIDEIGLGLMVGFRKPTNADQKDQFNESFNIGLAMMVDPNAKILGEGVEEGEALDSEIVIRTETKPRYSIGLVLSFAFN